MHTPSPFSELILREPQLNEIGLLFSIRARTRQNVLSTKQLASLGITPEAVAGALARGDMMSVVCQHTSGLVGFCDADSRTGEVLVLAVLPDFEGQGIGRRLLSAIVDRLRASGHRELWLAASPDPQVRAHGFYRAQGWRPNGKYADGAEVLTLRCPPAKV